MHICCICTGNTCRSPMLATLLRAEAKKSALPLTVSSAGVAASVGQAANPHSLSCMQARGAELAQDLSAHRSCPVHSLDLSSIDQFYCMSADHAFALFDAGVAQEKLFVVNAEHGGVPDPYGGPLETYQDCADVLQEIAQQIIQQLPTDSPDTKSDH